MGVIKWIYIYSVIFISGLCVGSYMNVLIYRVPRGIGTVGGRSFCPDCSHTLRWYDLFPLFSYIFLRGRCRYCGAKISPRYAVIELLNALLWVAYAYKFMLYPLTMIGYFIFSSALVCIIFIDAEHMLIFDRFNIAIAAAGVILAADNYLCKINHLHDYPITLTVADRLIGAVCVSGVFFLIALISRGRAMGGGDIKLTAAAGLVLGWRNMLGMLLLASIAGAAGSLIQLAVQKRHAGQGIVTADCERASTQEENGGALSKGSIPPMGHAVPFGPYLAGAMIVMSFVGNELVSFYLKLCGF